MVSGATSFSRQDPSPRYRGLIDLYREMHISGDPKIGLPPEATFDGQSLLRQAGRIKKLVEKFYSKTLLDYGSGKGCQYRMTNLNFQDGTEIESIPKYWGVETITCYDPGYPPFSDPPDGTFDGVISTDVLEHCPEDDIPWIVGELFSFARRFVFMNAACYPAQKHLPNGENAHTTVKPAEWWEDLTAVVAADYPDVRYYLIVETIVRDPSGAPTISNHLIEG